jgi:DNA repair exonuclease SbcCD ATPase subunit
VRDLRAQLAEARIDEPQILRLRRAAEAVTKAGAALAAAAASVRLRAARDLVVDGERLVEGEERTWSCDAPTRIVIEGVASFEVRPGGADLEGWRAKEQEARHALDRELARAGAAGVAEAEERFSRRTGLAAQLAHAEPLLAEAAPEGVAALEEERRARALERAALGEPDGEAPSLAEAEARLSAANQEATRTRAEREALRGERARSSDDASRRVRAVAELTREWAEATARLEALPPEEELSSARNAARTALVDARALTDLLAQDLAGSSVTDAELAVEQERRVLERFEGERASKQARSLLLEATIRVQGGEDLHERMQRAEAELDERGAALRAVESRAAAARELLAALHAARREVQERLVSPVIERVRPYLAALLPGRRLRMDENWGVVGVGTGDAEEDFEALSGGAKEQVSILVRLALAEVLGEPEPLPVVLDDALVNTDRGRLAEMLRILYRAARKQQILVFSCHDVELERLGETKRFELRS